MDRHDGTGLPKGPLARHNVVAVYADMERARRAVEAVEAGGIDSARISLLGPGPQEAQADTETEVRDERVTRHVEKRAAMGAAAGAAAGGAVGFLAGLAAFAIPGVGPVIGAGVWAATAAGGVAGGAAGGVIGGVSSLPMTREWELTFEPVKQGKVMVAVHCEEDSEADRGAEILEKHDPISLDRYDAQGKRVALA